MNTNIFRISRSSTYLSKPHPDAFEKPVIVVDRRCVDDPKKIPFNDGTDGDWYIKGTNHRIENGSICRDMGFENDWFIEISDIMQFVRDNGRCVVDIDDDGFNTIEIYDSWRE